MLDCIGKEPSMVRSLGLLRKARSPSKARPARIERCTPGRNCMPRQDRGTDGRRRTPGNGALNTGRGPRRHRTEVADPRALRPTPHTRRERANTVQRKAFVSFSSSIDLCLVGARSELVERREPAADAALSPIRCSTAAGGALISIQEVRAARARRSGSSFRSSPAMSSSLAERRRRLRRHVPMYHGTIAA